MTPFGHGSTAIGIDNGSFLPAFADETVDHHDGGVDEPPRIVAQVENKPFQPFRIFSMEGLQCLAEILAGPFLKLVYSDEAIPRLYGPASQALGFDDVTHQGKDQWFRLSFPKNLEGHPRTFWTAHQVYRLGDGEPFGEFIIDFPYVVIGFDACTRSRRFLDGGDDG